MEDAAEKCASSLPPARAKREKSCHEDTIAAALETSVSGVVQYGSGASIVGCLLCLISGLGLDGREGNGRVRHPQPHRSKWCTHLPMSGKLAPLQVQLSGSRGFLEGLSDKGAQLDACLTLGMNISPLQLL